MNIKKWWGKLKTKLAFTFGVKWVSGFLDRTRVKNPSVYKHLVSVLGVLKEGVEYIIPDEIEEKYLDLPDGLLSIDWILKELNVKPALATKISNAVDKIAKDHLIDDDHTAQVVNARQRKHRKRKAREGSKL